MARSSDNIRAHLLRRILRYGSYMLAANVVVAILTFVVGMLGARERSKEAFGDYATFVLIYSVGQTIVTSGVNQIIQKFGADERDRLRFAALAYRSFVFLLFLSIILGAPTAYFFGIEFALGVVAVPLVAVFTWTRSIARSRFRAEHEARLIVVASLSKSLSQLAFITMSDIDAALTYGDFAGITIAGLFSVWLLPRSLDVSMASVMRFEVGRPFLQKIVGFGWPLWFAGEVYSIRSSLVSSFTRAAFGPTELASLAMGEQLQRIAMKPSELLGQAALPGLVRAETDRKEVYRSALTFALFLIPLLGIASAGASPLILQLFEVKEKYPEVPLLLMISSVAYPASTVETALLQYCVAEGRNRVIMVSQLFTIGLVGLLLHPLATTFGLYGVVLIAAIGHVCYCACLLVALKRSHPVEVSTSLSLWLRATLAAMIAVAALFMFRDGTHPWVASLGISVGFALMLLLLGIRPTLGASEARGPQDADHPERAGASERRRA